MQEVENKVGTNSKTLGIDYDLKNRAEQMRNKNMEKARRRIKRVRHAPRKGERQSHNRALVVPLIT